MTLNRPWIGLCRIDLMGVARDPDGMPTVRSKARSELHRDLRTAGCFNILFPRQPADAA